MFEGFFAARIEVEIWIWGVGSIFYIISVVDGVVNLIDDIYGGRTSLFLTSQRMPSRYVLRLQHHTLSIILLHKNPTNNVICVDILMRCAVNSIFDCAGVFATPYN